MRDHKNFFKGALCGALVMLFAVGLTAGIFVWFTGAVGKNVVGSDTQRKLKEIERVIDSQYLRSDEVDDDVLEDYIVKGYVAGLNDPYSAYYNEEETKALYETTSGEFGGIGVVMSQNLKSNIITMVNVYEDSPADNAGFLNNDILYKVDGEDIRGQALEDVVKKVKGDKGTKISLTVLRGENKKEYEAVVTRDTIEAQTVTYEMKKERIGYIRVTEFDKVTYSQFEKALSELYTQGMEALIIDLRGNPGGNLSTVCSMLDLILPEGTIVYTEDRDGQKRYAESDEEHKLEIPLTVLADSASASASEIFAGAVQDYGIGTIVGTTTYGKGVVQQIFNLSDGTCMKLTISEYFTPKGRNIDGKGIEPDVEVEYEYNEENPEEDNQLDKAIEVTEEKIK